MIVNGIPVYEGFNDIIVAQNIANVLRRRLCNKSMLLIKTRDYLSDALKEKYDYENLLISMNEQVQAQHNTIAILIKEIQILQRATRTSDPKQPIKLRRSASF